MWEILGQSHWCSQDSISRNKILISNPQVPNMKTCPKSLNNRLTAGFQISDWNSNFQSPLVLTTEKLLRIFTHKDLFTIKNSIHKIYCLLLLSIMCTTQWHNPLSNQRASAFSFLCQCLFLLTLLFSLFTVCTIPSYPFSFFFPLLWYNIIHSSNHNFYLGITHFFKNYFQLSRGVPLRL